MLENKEPRLIGEWYGEIQQAAVATVDGQRFVLGASASLLATARFDVGQALLEKAAEVCQRAKGLHAHDTFAEYDLKDHGRETEDGRPILERHFSTFERDVVDLTGPAPI